MATDRNENFVTDEVQQVIRDVLTDKLGAHGLRSVEARVGYDQEEDEALFVDVYFALTEKALDPTRFHGLITVLRDALEAQGEYRFPYMRYHFDEKQQVAGWQ